jgi:hypothetical protein
MHPFYVLLALFALLCLLVLVLFVRWERRKFAQLGKAQAWLPVRIATLPILAVTAALVFIPTSRISGMEALAAFYLMLLTVAPLFWFVAHCMVGKFTRPPLTFRESSQIAASPLLLLIALGLLAQFLQSFSWALLRTMGVEG